MDRAGRARAAAGELQFRVRNLLRSRGFEVVRTTAPQANLLALHLDRLFDRLAIDCVVDVGARIGDYGLWLRRNGYGGRIASFEPVSDSFAQLKGRAADDPPWDAYNMALGSQNGEAEINVTDFSEFSSFLSPSVYSDQAFGSTSAVVRTETVAVRRLDGVQELAFGGAERVYLKMDTQGWDLEVLAGASSCLDRVVALQSEVSMRAIYEDMPSFAESLEHLRDLGYGISGLFPVVVDANLEVIEFDCVAVRRGVSPPR